MASALKGDLTRGAIAAAVVVMVAVRLAGRPLLRAGDMTLDVGVEAGTVIAAPERVRRDDRRFLRKAQFTFVGY